MTCRVGIFCAEGRSKGINIAKCHRISFSIKLSAHSQIGRLAEEILRIVGLAVFSLGKVVEVKGCDLEHGSGTLTVTRCDQRSVEILESPFVKEFVDGESQCAAHSQHGSERIGAGTQVSYLAKEFQCVALLLQGIAFNIGCAVDLKALGLHFAGLAFALRLYKHAFDADA